MASIMKGAEPWGADGDTTGVLVIHGLTGSPQSVKPWAEAIASEGRTVLVPRLPGHGTDIKDLEATTSSDWIGEAEMSLRGLQERCDRIFVCGLSMGGTVTLDLAQRFGDAIAGIVTVNAATFVTDPRAKLAPILGRISITLKGVSNDIADPTRTELAYAKVGTRSTWSHLQHQRQVRAGLASITQPALLFVSRQDHVVPPQCSAEAFEKISSTDKELVWLEKSYHVATLDYDADLIFQKTNAFIAAHTS